jgi:hypothetical protein
MAARATSSATAVAATEGTSSRPGAPPALPLVALEQRRDAPRGPTARNPVPRGPPNFAPDAVSRSAPSCSSVTPSWPDRLAGVHVEQRTPVAAVGRHLVGGLDRPDLVVGVLEVDRERVVAQQRRDVVGVDEPRAVDPDDVEVVAVLVPEPFAGPQHRGVLDGADDEVPPVLAAAFGRAGRAQHGEVDGLGAPGGPDESRGHRRPTAAATVAVARSSRSRAARPSRCRREGSPTRPARVEPRLPRLRPQRPGGGVIEVDAGRHARTLRRGGARSTAAARYRAPPVRTVSEEGGDVRVLVVSEDVKERLRAVSALRLHADAEVVEAASADEARRLLLVDREEYDVLVLDGDMRPRAGSRSSTTSASGPSWATSPPRRRS